MATLASDSFDRADSTSIGSDWTEVLGGWEIVSNKLKVTSNNIGADNEATWNTALGASPAADYDVECVLRKEVLVGGLHVFGRYTDSDNYYLLNVNTFNQSLKMFKQVSGSYTQLGSTYSAGQSNDTDITVKLRMAGSDIRGDQGGVERITATDSDLTSTGKPGLGSDSINCLFNDFAVYGTAASAGGGNDWPTFQSRGFRNWRFSG